MGFGSSQPVETTLTQQREAFARDGAVVLRGALDVGELAAAERAWDWSLANPGPFASRIPSASEATFYQDLYNPRVLEGYGDMLRASPLPARIAALWGAPEVWFMYEQVFLKEGGEARRTPWHQDSSYLAIGGDHLAVAWITFEPLAAEDSLEFVRGSHRGVLYNGSKFELGDDTAPLHAGVICPACRTSRPTAMVSTSSPSPSSRATWSSSTPACCPAARPPTGASGGEP